MRCGATEAIPLFATAFISIAAQMFLLSNPGGWPYLGFERDGGPEPRDFLTAAADPVLVLFFAGLVLSRAILQDRPRSHDRRSRPAAVGAYASHHAARGDGDHRGVLTRP